jgi:hypothetical protein
MANEFKVRKSLVVNGSGSVLLDVQGSQGQLFSITDSLSGSLFAVKDISGMPVMEAFSDNTVRMGQFGQKALFVSQSRVGIGKETGLTATLDVSGSAAVSGSLNVSGSLLINGTSFTALPTSRNLQDFTATSGQTTFTVTNGYIVGLLDVYVNGSKLTSSEFTATNGTTFVLTVASTTGDQVQSINYTASVNGISGAGNANYVPKFTASGTIGNSLIYDNGTQVGIGTSSPTKLLSVYEGTSTTLHTIKMGSATSPTNGYMGIWYGQLRITNGTTYNTASGWVADGAYAPTEIYMAANSNDGFITFSTANSNVSTPTERMRITSGGNVLIGTTTDNGNKLQVTGSISASGNISGANINGSSFSMSFGSSFNYGVGYLKSSTNGITVTTSTTTIFTSTNIGSVLSGNLVVVTGVRSGNGVNFVDLILYINSGSISVISSQVFGSPPSRNYSVSNENLNLSMASGTYIVSCVALIQGYTNT